jgi:hypothetical protein
MKKILGLILVISLLVSCSGPGNGTKTKRKDSGDDTLLKGEVIGKTGRVNLWMTTYEVDGIEYRVFTMYQGGMYTINHTKELLEVELLKKQLK